MHEKQFVNVAAAFPQATAAFLLIFMEEGRGLLPTALSDVVCHSTRINY